MKLMIGILCLVLLACGGSHDDSDPTVAVSDVASPSATIPRSVTASPTAIVSPRVGISPTANASPDASAITLTINPETGSYGTEFIFQYTGLTPNARYLIVIREPSGSEFPAQVYADASGTDVVILGAPVGA